MSNKEEHSGKNVSSPELPANNFNIPEEFIDPISCEVMSLPMTLPSGKTIDCSTLMKHEDSNAKWGRSPTDPFTGQIFTSLRKPVLNTSLKARIDQFLLSNAHIKETYSIHRTVGRKTKPISVEQQIVTKLNDVTTNQQLLSKNLEDVINAAIEQNNIVRYTLDDEDVKDIRKSCNTCNDVNNLYLTPCQHFICRSCLLSNFQLQCKSCFQVFVKSQVQKYHDV